MLSEKDDLVAIARHHRDNRPCEQLELPARRDELQPNVTDRSRADRINISGGEMHIHAELPGDTELSKLDADEFFVQVISGLAIAAWQADGVGQKGGRP